MQNRLVHHLIGRKLCCALPKCTSVQNYIVNLDLHVHCQSPKYYMYYTSVSLCTTCVCLLLSHDTKVPLDTLQIKIVCKMHAPCEPPKMKNVGETPTSHGHRSPLCTMVLGAQHWSVMHNAGRWCTTQSCTHKVVHNLYHCHMEMTRTESLWLPLSCTAC